MNKTFTAIAILLLSMWFGSNLTRAQQTNYYPFASRSDYFAKLHVIRVFVRRYGRSRVNRLFVATADSGDGASKGLYGYWPEGHSILLLDHFNPVFDSGKELTDYDWLEYKTRIDLRTDVVATERDVGWSSYLVDRPSVRRIIDACLRSGRKITILRKRYTFRTCAAQNKHLQGKTV